MSSTHIILPDSHNKPGQNFRRYDWLSKLIVDINPDVVVDLGDFSDVESLCSYDKGRKSFEGRRFASDVLAAKEADDHIWSPIKGRKKKLPRRVRHIGNHENRIDRAIEASPELEGSISIDNLGYSDNWEVIPFLVPNEIDGVVYSHYLVSGVMGRAISGEHPEHAILAKQHKSAVVGHSHLVGMCSRTDAMGKRMVAISAGCFIDQYQNYAGPQVNKMWWEGITVLHNVEDGVFDPEFISLKRLEEVYRDD